MQKMSRRKAGKRLVAADRQQGISEGTYPLRLIMNLQNSACILVMFATLPQAQGCVLVGEKMPLNALPPLLALWNWQACTKSSWKYTPANISIVLQYARSLAGTTIAGSSPVRECSVYLGGVHLFVIWP